MFEFYSPPSSFYYSGWVSHIRHGKNKFTYPLNMDWVDIDDPPFFRLKFFPWIKILYYEQKDHLADRKIIETLLYNQFGIEEKGFPIHVLTHLRYLGHCFNSISIFHCSTSQGLYLILEVNNTPWNQTHLYALKWGETVHVKKELHVSPFNPTFGQTYVIRTSGSFPSHLVLHLDVESDSQNEGEKKKIMAATYSFRRKETSFLDSKEGKNNLGRFPSWRFPDSLLALLLIYWQAFKLYFFYRLPFYSNQK